MNKTRWSFIVALSAVLVFWPVMSWAQQPEPAPPKPPDAAKEAPGEAQKKDAPESPPKDKAEATEAAKPKPVESAPPPAAPAAVPAPPSPAAPAKTDLEPLPPPPKKMILNFRNASVREVLSQVARLNGLSVVFDTDISGDVTVISPGEVNTDEAIRILNAALSLKSIVAVRSGEVLKVVSLAAAPKSNVPVQTGSDPEEVEPGDHVLTQVIPIRYADASQLRQDLIPLIPDQASLVSNAGTNTLIYTARATDVRRLLTILKSLDSQIAEVADIRIFTLKNADATELAESLRDLFGDAAQQRSSTGRTSSSSFFDAMRDRIMQFRMGFPGPPPSPSTPGR